MLQVARFVREGRQNKQQQFARITGAKKHLKSHYNF